MNKNRFTKPGKGEAYDEAAALVRGFSDDKINANNHFDDVRTIVAQNHPILSPADVDHVVGKAFRVERGRRVGDRGMTMQVNVRLTDIDLDKLNRLIPVYGSQSQAVRMAIRHEYTRLFGDT